MMYKKIVGTLLTLLSLNLVYAHSRTEIGYRFLEEDKKTYLEVHLTSATIFDLLYHLHPDLISQEALNLSHYTSDYENYFNTTIDLVLNEKKQKLIYATSSLIMHDASITFIIDNFEEEIASYDIVVHGFDFYQKPSFTVFFSTPSVNEMHRLSKEMNRCSKAIPESNKHTEIPGNLSPYWVVGLVALLGLSSVAIVWAKSELRS